MNQDYRIARDTDLTEGAAVFAYYVGPTPGPDTLGNIVDVEDDGWCRVALLNGHYTSADASRLAVKVTP